jgi:O-acetyl-ADP-ribose deacetylase (regulator of RNase III)
MLEYEQNGVTVRLVQGDITRQQVDAIVNAANSSLLGGGGVDGAIHRAGGPAILAECRALGGCPTGEARITSAGRLPARYVIHTVGPVWQGGQSQEAALLASAYRNSLALAKAHHLTSIAFPSISTGAYRYPIDQAASIALRTILEVLQDPGTVREVTFALFSARDLQVYERALAEVAA